jgi:hypothetical protein
MAVAASLAPRWAASDPAYPRFGAALSSSGLPVVLAVVLGASAIGFVLLLLRPGQPRLLWLPNLAGFLGVLLLVVPGLAPLMESERQHPLRELAVLAGRTARSGEPLLVIGYKRYSVLFYSGKTARFFDNAESARDKLSPSDATEAPSAPSDTVLLFGEERKLRDFGLPPAQVEPLGSGGTYRLWRVPRGALSSQRRETES